MSQIIDVSTLSNQIREKIVKDLTVVPKETKYGKQENILTFDIYSEDDSEEKVTIPFSYFLKNFDEFPNDDIDFPKTNYEFKGTLNKIQNEIKQETYDLLNKNRSILISLYCGAGKCLHPDTPVLMYDGTIKRAADIEVNDQLMGDDDTPRNVLSTCSGKEKMYKIKQHGEGDDYIVNESHILSVVYYDMGRIGIGYRGKKDLSVKTVLELQKSGITVHGYKSFSKFSTKPLPVDEYGSKINVYDYGYSVMTLYRCGNKDIRINRSYLVNDEETRIELLASILDFHYKEQKETGKFNRVDSHYDFFAQYLYEYYLNLTSKGLTDDILFLIRSLGLKVKLIENVVDEKLVYSLSIDLDLLPQVGPWFYTIEDILFRIPSRISSIDISTRCDNDDETETEIEIEPLDVGNYNGFVIDGNHRFLLGDFTVTHNTIYSIFLASKLKYKTMILCHRVNLIDQWKYSIEKVCPDAKIKVIGGVEKKSKKDNENKESIESDFYIMNVSNVTKKPRGYFNDIGVLVVDEAHTICTDNMSQSLFRFSPKYTIFLTATPDRTDGKGKILDLYVGPDRIVRKLWRPFNVYIINTQIKIKTEQTAQGKLDWNSVLSSQCENSERNDFIVDLIRFFKNRNFLVLCKRVSQGKYLLEKLRLFNEDVDMFAESDIKFNRDSRILLSTYSKTGVGFDHPKLDALIIASDVEEGIEQYVGRVFRREDVSPMVFDMVDKLHTLFKHYCTRKELYESIGGCINSFEMSFPEFEQWRQWDQRENTLELSDME